MKSKVISLLFCIIAGVLIWLIPPPEGISPKAIQLLAIFVFTILGIITRPYPMGMMALIGLMLVCSTKTLSFADTFSGFVAPVVWLIVCAFFIARGFIKTRLGERIAYMLMSILGKNTLTMGYGVALTDLILAPIIPSSTARIGGVIYPVITSLAKSFESHPHDGPRKLGAYIIQVAFQCSLITSAMFLTAMAGNPLVANIAKEVGIDINWGSWALATSIPGIVSLIVIPYILYKIYPPEIKHTPHATDLAKEKLKELGSIKAKEWIMIFAFVVLITLWILGPTIDMSATITALIGLSFLLFTTVLTWDDLLKERSAWDTLIWFASLVMMASFLNKLQLTTWFSNWIVLRVSGFEWYYAFAILVLVYFYSHYFFANNVSHIGAMYPSFLLISVAVGTPPILAALSLGFFSSLFGGLTHYGCGPAPILYSSGYVKIREWWRLGFVFSVINIVIWIGIGAFWWRLLGHY